MSDDPKGCEVAFELANEPRDGGEAQRFSLRMAETRQAAEEAGQIARVIPGEVAEFKTKILPLEPENGFTPPAIVTREMKESEGVGGSRNFNLEVK